MAMRPRPPTRPPNSRSWASPRCGFPDVGGPVFDALGNLLRATRHTVIATGILNLWMHEPAEVAAQYASLTATHGHRFLDE